MTDKELIKELKNTKVDTLDAVTEYIVNTLKAKVLYKKGGWREVRKKYSEKECFNHNYSISATSICMKLRDNGVPINISIQSKMEVIEKLVNIRLGIKAVEYYVDRKNHALRIKL